MAAAEPITWPPTVEHMMLDRKVTADETSPEDRARMGADLAAALAVVGRLRRDTLNVDGDPLSTLPSPSADVALGVVRLAVRWNDRRRSPDGLISAGELGSSRIPSFDADIERLCGIGRYVGPVFA